MQTFSGRRIFGYPAIVLALVGTGLLAFGLWVHHMFATGLPRQGYAFYTAASMAVSLPAGIQIFCWIATIWDGRPRFAVPMLWVVGFIVTFVIGGMTGVMLASVPIDLQLHDTYFVVAHFHYVLIGGAVFPLLGAITYWYPKMTGRMMSETWARVSFWLGFLGFQVAFMPMHFLGILGMPRRVYTYPAGHRLGRPEPGRDDRRLRLRARARHLRPQRARLAAPRRRRRANPWDAPGLEWATSSPPPSYNHAHIPEVDGHTPLWD